MNSRPVRPRILLALVAGAAACAVWTGSAFGMISIIYDDNVDGSVTTIVRGDNSVAGLGPERGAFRQEPSVDHLLGGDADAPNRLAKLSAGELIGKTGSEMASILEREIDGSCAPAGCASSLVAIDEITGKFADGTQAATNLTEALVALSRRTHPKGGTYAQRTHFYLGPGVVTAIGYGLGTDHNLGRNGTTKRTGYATVMKGLARSGGVWLEMYRPGNAPTGKTYALEKAAWQSGPRDVAQMITRFGGSLDRVHLLMSNPGVPPVLPVLPGGTRATESDYCTTMSCIWSLAKDPTTMNPRLVENGVGEYQLGSKDLALEWLREYNAALAVPPPAQPDATWLKRFQEPALGVVEGAPFKRIGKPRKPTPGIVAVKLQASKNISVVFRIGVNYRKVRAVKKGTRRVEFPIPRCGSCTAMEVRIVVGTTTYDTFRIAALAADRQKATG